MSETFKENSTNQDSVNELMSPKDIVENEAAAEKLAGESSIIGDMSRRAMGALVSTAESLVKVSEENIDSLRSAPGAIKSEFQEVKEEVNNTGLEVMANYQVLKEDIAEIFDRDVEDRSQLPTAAEVKDVMAGSQSKDEWNANCDKIKEAFDGKYPDFWYKDIIMSGLASQTSSKWEK